jgi:ketosteroid isomerase-like protein
MATHKDVVEEYFEAFRRSDHARVLACLTADVVWDLPGHAHLEGKAAFDGEIENEEFEGEPRLVISRLVEEGDTVVAVGTGEACRRDGSVHRFAYCDVFTFAGDLVARVESYLVATPDGGAAG